MIPMLRTQLFIVMGLVDAVPMIGVGIALLHSVCGRLKLGLLLNPSDKRGAVND